MRYIIVTVRLMSLRDKPEKPFTVGPFKSMRDMTIWKEEFRDQLHSLNEELGHGARTAIYATLRTKKVSAEGAHNWATEEAIEFVQDMLRQAQTSAVI